MTVLALLAGLALSGAQAPTVEQKLPANPPVSVERIHQRLHKPAAIQLPSEQHADFRTSVTEEFDPPETVLEALRRELSGDTHSRRIVASPGSTPPLVEFDVLQKAIALKRKLSATLRARAARQAREDVAAALAEFCALHDCSVLEQETGQSLPEGVLAR